MTRSLKWFLLALFVLAPSSASAQKECSAQEIQQMLESGMTTSRVNEICGLAPNQPRDYKFTIQADKAWQTADIKVEKGDSVTVTYESGTWTTFVGGLLLPATPRFKPTDYPPTGTNPRTSDYRLGSSTTLGSVLVKVDSNATFWEAVTEGKEGGSFTPKDTGKLQFRMNDSAPDDNEGSVVVKITVKPGK